MWRQYPRLSECRFSDLGTRVKGQVQNSSKVQRPQIKRVLGATNNLNYSVWDLNPTIWALGQHDPSSPKQDNVVMDIFGPFRFENFSSVHNA